MKCADSRRERLELVVAVHAPGAVGGSSCVAVTAINAGIDWNAGRIFVRPEKDLSALTVAEREAIIRSARGGQSWHAYQAQKKLRARIAELEAEVAALRAAGS